MISQSTNGGGVFLIRWCSDIIEDHVSPSVHFVLGFILRLFLKWLLMVVGWLLVANKVTCVHAHVSGVKRGFLSFFFMNEKDQSQKPPTNLWVEVTIIVQLWTTWWELIEHKSNILLKLTGEVRFPQTYRFLWERVEMYTKLRICLENMKLSRWVSVSNVCCKVL